MPRNRSLTKGRWRAIALSILLHSAIIAAAVIGWFSWSHTPPPVQTIAIEASVIDEHALTGIAPPPKPEPAPPDPAPPEPEPEPEPVEELGPPKPDPAEIERKEAERLELEQAQIEKQQQELKAREDAERLEAEKQAEKQAIAKAAAEKAAAEKAASDKRAAEKKSVDDAAAAKKAAEEKVRLAREAELLRALEAEERGNAARSSDEAMRWHAQISARIARAWIKPPSARPGISCIVSVTQVAGGEVTAVRVNSCSPDDAALRESVEAAVYRASPLPTPPVGVPFERNLELNFSPTS